MKFAKDIIKKLIRKTPFKVRSFLLAQLSQGPPTTEVSFDVFSVLLRLKEQGWLPETIIDVGAHEGLWSHTVANHIFPAAEYFLFEPLNTKKEKIAIAMHGFKYHHYAQVLSDRKNSKVLFYEMETGSSMYEETSALPRQVKNHETHMLSEIADDISGRTLLKIDVQGAELDVLRGAGFLLKKVDVIVLELSLLNYNKNAPLAHELISYLAEQGFLLYDIAGFNRKLQGHTLVQFDGIFVRKESRIRQMNNDFSTPYNLYTRY